MLLDPDESQLVLLDFQPTQAQRLTDGAALTANAVRLARVARLFDVPVSASDWSSVTQDEVPSPLRAWVDKVFPRSGFSAAPELGERMRPSNRAVQGGNARSLPKHLQKAVAPAEPSRSTIVLAGLQVHVGVLQTALEMLEEEIEVWVVSDACGAATERDRDAAFDRLAAAGAELVTTEMLAFEWLRTASHPLYDEVLQALVDPLD